MKKTSDNLQVGDLVKQIGDPVSLGIIIEVNPTRHLESDPRMRSFQVHWMCGIASAQPWRAGWWWNSARLARVKPNGEIDL